MRLLILQCVFSVGGMLQECNLSRFRNAICHTSGMQIVTLQECNLSHFRTAIVTLQECNLSHFRMQFVTSGMQFVMLQECNLSHFRMQFVTLQECNFSLQECNLSCFRNATKIPCLQVVYSYISLSFSALQRRQWSHCCDDKMLMGARKKSQEPGMKTEEKTEHKCSHKAVKSASRTMSMRESSSAYRSK